MSVEFARRAELESQGWQITSTREWGTVTAIRFEYGACRQVIYLDERDNNGLTVDDLVDRNWSNFQLIRQIEAAV